MRVEVAQSRLDDDLYTARPHRGVVGVAYEIDQLTDAVHAAMAKAGTARLARAGSGADPDRTPRDPDPETRGRAALVLGREHVREERAAMEHALLLACQGVHLLERQGRLMPGAILQTRRAWWWPYLSAAIRRRHSCNNTCV